MNVADLEEALMRAFPREDAESWDHVGLSVGDPEAEVERVYIALDVTPAIIAEAAREGANVLVTHHPIYLKAPNVITPRAGEHPANAAAVFEAARLGISVCSFHTNLDRSPAAQAKLPGLLGAVATSSLEHPDAPGPGLGAICDVDPMTLSELAGRAARAFGGSPRVWGDPLNRVSRVAFLGGSLGDFGDRALRLGAQAIICGEAGYHVVQDLAIRGLCTILLGHDTSEYPFCDILASAVRDAGLADEQIIYHRPPRQWWTVPEGGSA